jgi:U4/U6 small nuclear ribonucleoprotein PRP4
MSKRNIYFGSLEDQLSQEQQQQQEEQVPLPSSQQEQIVYVTGNRSTVPQSVPPTQPTAASEEFDRRALAKTLKIPTEDLTVRHILISLNQPITIFGEGPGERRDRLRMMASKAIFSLPRAFELFPVLRSLCGLDSTTTTTTTNDSDEDNEEFYVPGSVDLIKVRSFLLEDSINRARTRKSLPPPLNHTIEQVNRTALYHKLDKSLDLKETFLDPNGRPLSCCTFTKNGNLYTGDWSGRIIKYSQGNKSELVYSVGDRITAMCSHDDSSNILFGTATGKIHYGSQVSSLPTNHAIKSLNWHPSNRFFASTSSDSLWRLWDGRGDHFEEVQVQEGHLGGISSGSWHPDGAIYSTGGTSDGLIRIWDCRMGKAIWTITNKSNAAISALAFSPSRPHLLASANVDGLLSFHDLRRVDAEFMKTAAHRSCCSSLKFTADGRVLISSGFDGSVRLWCPGDFRLVKDLPVSASKVTDIDFIDDNFKLAAVTFDRSVKIFSI